MNELIKFGEIKTVSARVEGIDFEAAREEVSRNLELYKSMLVTADNTTDIKKIITDLRRESKELNDAKIKIKRELTKDVTKMESEFKKLISIYDDAIKPLDEKVKVFEAEERQEKMDQAEDLVLKMLENTDYKPSDIERSNRWGNKTTTFASIEEDIMQQIENLDEKVAAIKDSISSKNSLLGGDYIKYGLYALDIKKPLQEVLGRINDHYISIKNEQEREKAQEERALKLQEQTQEQDVTPEETTSDGKMYTLDPEPDYYSAIEPTEYRSPVKVPLDFNADKSTEPYVAPWDVSYKTFIIEEKYTEKVTEWLDSVGIGYTVK